MVGENLNGRTGDGARYFTLHDFLAIGFRRRQLIVTTFLGILVLGVLVALLLPTQYESQMKILVRRERADSMVSANREPAYEPRTYVTEEELESEAELLKSWDLLTKVVVACDLHKSGSNSFWDALRRDESVNENERIGRAALALGKKLTVEPIRRTNLISVTYKTSNPEMAAGVLNTLASLYLDKHLALRRVPGAVEFFNEQAGGYREALEKTEAELANFSRKEGVVSPSLEKEIKVRRMAEFEAGSREAGAAVAQTRQRIHTLEAQLASLPSRQTTQVRTSDNPQLMQSLKAMLLDLELRRTQLLAKFEPSYRPVQDVEAQIAKAREAIAAAEKAPLREETTDRDPAYEALRTELGRSKTELAALEGRSAAMADLVQAYRAETQQLGRKEILHQDLLRATKAQEENYLLYLRKQEEARISEALDRQRISNAVIAQAATVPLEPSSNGLLVMVLVGLVACVASAMLAFVVDYWDPSFRTPEEVQSFLGSPVVAAIPKK
jgi:uncharacterized protein involved in exopolysaccharide biosynthesis